MSGRRGPQTRDRVLEVALALFNERGVTRVTTAEIAEAARINEGNLYYYFQRKEQLAEALFDGYEVAFLQAARRGLRDPNEAGAYADYQRGWFRLMWDFRFLYRDGAALRSLAPQLGTRMHDLNVIGQAAVRSVFGLMVAHGLMRADAATIDILIGNLWIVSMAWMDYWTMDQQGAKITAADLAWGFRQVEMLYRPYLTEAGIRAFEGVSL